MVRGLLRISFFLSILFDGPQSQQSTPFRKVGNNSNTNNNSQLSLARVDYIRRHQKLPVEYINSYYSFWIGS